MKHFLVSTSLILLGLTLATPASAQTTSCVDLTRTLAVGSRGTDVVSLQNFLISNGYMQPVTTQGYFGTITRSAVQKFQRENGISPSAGVVGTKTRTAIREMTCEGVTTAQNAETMVVQAQTAATISANVPVETGVPVLNSNPSATAKIYLDFNGAAAHTWKQYSVPTTPAYDIDENTQTFSDIERANIQNIWSRIAEMYSPFNINVTTVDPGAPYLDGQTLHVLIGGSSWTSGPASSVTEINSFTSATPNIMYVFENSFGITNTKSLSEATARAIGESFGLWSQNAWSGSFSTGLNRGDGMRAPIMGFSSFAQRAVWWNGIWFKGIYGDQWQNDTEVISGTINGFGNRTDDHSNSFSSATILTSNIPAKGIIERAGATTTAQYGGDVDYFSFTASGGQVTITATPAQYSPMLDPIIELHSSAGVLLAQADVGYTGDVYTLGYAGDVITQTLPAGTYYVSVKGHGWTPCTDTSRGECYKGADIGSYTLTVTGASTPTNPTAPSNTVAVGDGNGMLKVTWSHAGTNVTGFRIERSLDNANWTTAGTVGSAVRELKEEPVAHGLHYYRIIALNGTTPSTPSNTASYKVIGGDANLDGVVSGDDYSGIDFHILVPGGGKLWRDGDFNFDGYVTADDYSTIDFEILNQGAAVHRSYTELMRKIFLRR